MNEWVGLFSLSFFFGFALKGHYDTISVCWGKKIWVVISLEMEIFFFTSPPYNTHLKAWLKHRSAF